MSRAVESRRDEYARGRWCARSALEQFGVSDFALVPGPRRAPLWPQGFVGSITHSGSYCAAAVARSDEIRALGIDAEELSVLSQEVIEVIAGTRERSRWPHAGSLNWPALTFSAKESIYKAWSPITGRALEYRDVELDIDVLQRAFRAHLTNGDLAQVDGGLVAAVRGRFAVSGSHVFTLAYARSTDDNRPADG